MKIYMIRHGETRLNETGRLQGRIDEPLNQKGEELARLTGEEFHAVPFDLAFSSPLKRAYDTARLFLSANDNPIPEIRTDSRLLEIDWGAWDLLGCIPSNFEIPDKEEYKAFKIDPWNYHPDNGGETIHDVAQRTKDFFQWLTSHEEWKDFTVLVSTHGCAGRGFQCNFFENNDDYWRGTVPPNCCVSIGEVDEKGARMYVLDHVSYDKSLIYNPYAFEE